MKSVKEGMVELNTADSLDSGVVPTGQVSGPEAIKASKMECHHPETYPWLIPLRQRFNLLYLRTIEQLTEDAFGVPKTKNVQI